MAFSARGHGFDPRDRRGKISVSKHAFLSVICRDDTKMYALFRIRTLTAGLMCRVTPVQVKEPYSSLHDYFRGVTAPFILVQQFSSIGCTKASAEIKIQIYICLVKILVRHVASLENIGATKSHLQLRPCTCRLSSCKTVVYNVHLLIILERGCSSMYIKKETPLARILCSCAHQKKKN